MAAQAQPAPVPENNNPRARFPDAQRLLSFIEAARVSPTSPLNHIRAFYTLAEQQTAGPWWKQTHSLGSRKALDRRPLNPLGEAVRTYHPHLMGETLVPIVEPSGLGDRGSAKLLEYRLRQWAEDAKYAVEDEKRVIDSILALGITYISRRDGGVAVATENGTLDMGQPSVQRISPKRMVVDPTPGLDSWDNASAIGHWMPVDRQSLLAAGIGRAELLNSIPNVWENQEETRDIMGDQGSEDEHLADTILLWELCFRWQGRLFCCTLPPVQGMNEFVVEPYELVNEPEGSRYVVTALNSLPDHLDPISPAMVIMDSHLAQAAIVAKLVEQIEELERKYVGEQGTQDTILRLKERGGDAFLIAKGKIQEFIKGGMVKEALEAFAFLQGIGKQVGPNTDLLGGRDDPSDTATGSSILAGNGAFAMGFWARKINESRTKELRRVAALLLQGGDQRTFMMETPAGPKPLIWDAENLDISYDQYRFRVKPTSGAGAMDPRMKLRSLFEMGTMLPGFMQFFCGMLQAEPQKVLRIVSDLSGMSELDEMLPTGDMQGLQQMLFQMLAQGGYARPAMGGGVSGGMGGAAQLPHGPQTKVGQMNSDIATRQAPAA